MSLPPPKIDHRTYADLVAQTEALAQSLTGWRPPAGTDVDAGRAMIRLFGRLALLTHDRLNRIPDKYFLHYLDLIGTQLRPPQPARVPLTFTLAPGSTTDAFVPALTQVAAPATETAPEVVFETEQDLVVTPAQLQAVWVKQPREDAYHNCTAIALGQVGDFFSLFEADQSLEHSLYLAADRLFSGSGEKTIKLSFVTAAGTPSLLALPLTWSYWSGEQWQLASAQADANEWEIRLPRLPAIQPCLVAGLKATWLKAQLNTPLLSPRSSSPSLPTITAITATVAGQAGLQATEGTGFAPDACWSNDAPLDLSKPIYPLGEQPRLNDTFRIGSQRALGQPGATVYMQVNLRAALIHPAISVELIWEIWDGSQWVALGRSSRASAKLDPQQALQDDTQALTRSGRIQFTLPRELSQDRNLYELRSRLLTGDYGTQPTLPPTPVYTTLAQDAAAGASSLQVRDGRGFRAGDTIQIGGGGAPMQVVTLTAVAAAATGTAGSSESTLSLGTALGDGYAENSVVLRQPPAVPRGSPPLIESVSLGYSYIQTNQPVEHCRTYNDFRFVNPFPLEGASSFNPFTPSSDRHPTLYLGFDRPFSNRPISLYAQVELPPPDTITWSQRQGDIPPQPAHLVWEYASAQGWQPLGVRDGTHTFTERGVVQFIGPPDHAETQEFGQAYYWLRVRWERGQFAVLPRLRRWLLNTVWASQAQTQIDEELGSSTGNPNQSFFTSQTPVLDGQRLQVGEATLPPETEQAQLRRQAGEAAIDIQKNQAGQLERVWVTWQAVPDFYGSEPQDRHYVMDYLSGQVRFGDGLSGRVPPLGRNNLRLSYRTGGGEHGDQPALVITQLKTTIPAIDQVLNLEPAGGGADAELLSQVQERGPKQLRHRGLAVTAQDFEDLAFAASPDVVRARIITPTFSTVGAAGEARTIKWLSPNEAPTEQHRTMGQTQGGYLGSGQTVVVIVPHSVDAQPVPSLALLERVKAYLLARCLPTVDLTVAGPDWVQVSIAADIAPQNLATADATRSAVLRRIAEFLHPLTGGIKGEGWAFGRLPHRSDLYALIEAVPGVDHVRSLSGSWLNSANQAVDLFDRAQLLESPTSSFLVFSGTHTVHIVF
ncbi:putative baseplate assembly protein [Phormidium tenue]|uniref:Putative baseplate assembly protein n=1 Tax=Phormidium tenue NIES-30 TaxID=549789 RepID=A0A1U7IXY0_9CYAN|nr:putative baseplate assembly protein [Phormidium tenue]MBD2233296.1 putative baseplate assembly protein [Phormidium tenue FACHB-1052]OKH43272.1 putative baseplate assembly protein [Phormidium tenue NIES-30]